LTSVRKERQRASPQNNKAHKTISRKCSMTTCTSPFPTDFVGQLKKLVEVVVEAEAPPDLAVTIVVDGNA